MEIITSKNHRLKKERSRSSINRSINNLTTGFTMNIHPEYITQNIISDPELLTDKIYTERGANKNYHKKIKEFIEDSYHLTIAKLINTTEYIYHLLRMKGTINTGFKSHSVSSNDLEDTIPIRKPYAGSSGYANYLDKLKFIE